MVGRACLARTGGGRRRSGAFETCSSTAPIRHGEVRRSSSTRALRQDAIMLAGGSAISHAVRLYERVIAAFIIVIILTCTDDPVNLNERCLRLRCPRTLPQSLSTRPYSPRCMFAHRGILNQHCVLRRKSHALPVRYAFPKHHHLRGWQKPRIVRHFIPVSQDFGA